MFCPRQLFRTLNRCRPRCRPRWLSTVQHDSSNVLQQQPTHTIQHDSSDIMQQPAHSKKTLQIMAAANVGNFPTCFRIAAKMKASGLTPDISTYNALMSAAAQDGNAILSWAIFDDMLLIGIRPTISTFTHLIDAQRRTSSRYLWLTLEVMNSFSIKPNAQIYTSIINTFIGSRNLEMAIQYLFAMRSQDIVPELSAAEAVIKLAAERGYPRLAIDITTYFEDISHRRVGDVAWVACLHSAAQAFYMDGVATCWNIAVNELDIVPNEGVCLSVLNAAARHGVPDLATDVLRVLNLSGIAWKEYHFAALIEAFCHNNQLKDALITLHIMRSNQILPVPSTSIAILDSIKDVETLDSALVIIDEIQKEKGVLDIDALKVIIQASVLLRDLQRAVGVYKFISDYNLKPDVNIFNLLLDGCIAMQHRQFGDGLLADMKKSKVEPNKETYEKMIRLCLTQEVYEDAFFYLEEMKAVGFVPPQTVYEALVLKCQSMDDTRMDIALEEMREYGYSMSKKRASKVDSRPVTKEPEMPVTAGLDEETMEYIKTGGTSREPS